MWVGYVTRGRSLRDSHARGPRRFFLVVVGTDQSIIVCAVPLDIGCGLMHPTPKHTHTHRYFRGVLLLQTEQDSWTATI